MNYLVKLMMLSVACLTMLACSTTVPLKMKFPTPPEVLMEEGAKMETIEERKKNSNSQN